MNLDGFRYESNALYCENVPISEIIDKFGTPIYVYSENHIRNKSREYVKSLSKPGMICFSVKALSNIHVLKILAEEGCCFDVVSGGEIQRCIEAGIDTHKLIFSGVGKTEQEIRYAIKSGIFSINAESFSEIDRIAKIAAELETRAPIGIRINPNISITSHEYIQTGKKEDKFGINIEEVFSKLELIAKTPFLELKGIACHIGSQISDLAYFREAAQSMLKVISKIDKLNLTLSFIDMGGGSAINYIKEKELSPREVIDVIEKVLDGRNELLVLEPGRSIVGNAGALITRVEYLKSKFAIVDAGMNDLIRPALYKAEHKVIDVSLSFETKKPLKVVGPICESGDYLSQEANLQAKEGDLIAVLGAGAYGFVMSSNYNSRTRAPEILVNRDNFRLIRRRESVADLIRLETEL